MASLNKVMLIGNLGEDPEVTYTPSGTAKATLRVATNEKWKDKDGETKERTEWHRVILWGRLAEVAGQYLAKGRQVYVEGRLQTRSWEDKDGNKRWTTEIVASSMVMLGGGKGKNGQDAGGGYNDSGYGNDNIDDVPF